MPHRLNVIRFADRLLLIARSITDVEICFQQRGQLLATHQVQWIECWFCNPSLDCITPVFIDGRDIPMEFLYRRTAQGPSPSDPDF